jgi:hypothetical protein
MQMGGHSAWRKRIERGELAKQSSGAICRHRPHFGRKGKDLVKNRKGNIGNGNPKKRKSNKKGTQHDKEVRRVLMEKNRDKLASLLAMILLAALMTAVAFLFCRS